MTVEEEEELVRSVMKDSMNTHNEAQWEGLQQMIAISTARDIAIPEYDVVVKEEAMDGMQQQEEEGTTPWNPALIGQSYSWMETIPCTQKPMHVATWSPSLQREEVVQAPMQAPPAMTPAWQGSAAHL
ncbi:putative histone-lysine N-methyltransferase ATXR3 [Hordeum vulgare]|nr:putative histone-lysine N-methyltransferase ATXR3 [Hordeum vulgare]